MSLIVFCFACYKPLSLRWERNPTSTNLRLKSERDRISCNHTLQIYSEESQHEILPDLNTTLISFLEFFNFQKSIQNTALRACLVMGEESPLWRIPWFPLGTKLSSVRISKGRNHDIPLLASIAKSHHYTLYYIKWFTVFLTFLKIHDGRRHEI